MFDNKCMKETCKNIISIWNIHSYYITSNDSLTLHTDDVYKPNPTTEELTINSGAE